MSPVGMSGGQLNADDVDAFTLFWSKFMPIVLSMVGAIVMIIGAAMRPWVSVIPIGASELNMNLYGPQPWAGLTIATGILVLLAGVTVIIGKLRPVWLGLIAGLGGAGLAFSIAATEIAHRQANDIASSIDANDIFGIQTGHAPFVAIIGAAILFASSFVPFLINLARGSSPTAKTPRWAQSSAVVATARPPGVSDTKTCTWCAETIKKDAVICRFCGRDATAEGGTQP